MTRTDVPPPVPAPSPRLLATRPVAAADRPGWRSRYAAAVLGSALLGTPRHVALTLLALADDTGAVTGHSAALGHLGRVTGVRQSWIKKALRELEAAHMIARPAAAAHPDTARPILLTLLRRS